MRVRRASGAGRRSASAAAQINDQAHHGLRDEAAAANAEPPDFDQAGQLGCRPHHDLPLARFKMDAIIADQHGRGDLPRTSGQDEIERQPRLAGP